MNLHEPEVPTSELDEFGRHMSANRPVASERTLERAFTRAQGARRDNATGLMWRSSRPRTPTKAIAAIAATLAAAGGVTAIGVGAATAAPPPASLNCPTGAVTTYTNVLGITVCAAVLNTHGFCPASFPIKIQIPGLAAVCIKL